MFAFKFEVCTKKCPCKNKSKFNRTVWLIYPRHCAPFSIKIGQHLVKLCTEVFWCVFEPCSVFVIGCDVTEASASGSGSAEVVLFTHPACG